jgi:pimeloyl-ACP methyl ester carboxylesterase
MSIRLTAAPVLLAAAATLTLASCSPAPGEARNLSAATTPAEALIGAPEQWFITDDVTMRYKVIGQGEPLLLLHGYTDRVEMWAGMADSLARDFRVIVPDVRGFGFSSKFGDPSDYGRKMVDDLVALLGHLQVDKFHVAGYSMGGVLSAHLALDHPDRVRSATFAAGAFWPDSARAAQAVGPHVDALERGEGLFPFFEFILPTWSDSAIRAAIPPLWSANDSASLVASMRGFLPLMIDSTRLATARTPAIAVVSVKDRVHPQSQFVARHWPGLELIELQTRDHSDIFLAPELLEAIRRNAGIGTP